MAGCAPHRPPPEQLVFRLAEAFLSCFNGSVPEATGIVRFQKNLKRARRALNSPAHAGTEAGGFQETDNDYEL